MDTAKGVKQFLGWRAYTSNTIGNKITSIDAKHIETGETRRFKAPIFIDCTGDGWIGYWAGAEYMYGREAVSEHGESWDEYGAMWSPDSADIKVMGASLLWRTFESDSAYEFPEVPWATHVTGQYSASKGTWNWELISDKWHQVDHGEQIRDHMLKAIYGSFYNEKQLPGSEKLKLEWVSHLLGKRESRRLVGDYIFTFNDVRDLNTFPDAVVMEDRAVDVHYR